MRRPWVVVFFISFFLAGAGVSLAAGSIPSGKDKAGRVCEACHGKDGKTANALIPKLEGQQFDYLVLMLKDFKSGKRKNEQMAPVSEKLKDADIEDLAAYYSSLKPPVEQSDPVLAAKGKGKFETCQECHGVTGEGQGGIPRIGGQHADYLAGQINAYRNNSRPNIIMSNFVKELTDDEIKAVAAYAAGLKKIPSLQEKK